MTSMHRFARYHSSASTRAADDVWWRMIAHDTWRHAITRNRMQALDFFEHAVVFSQHEWLGDKDSVSRFSPSRLAATTRVRPAQCMHFIRTSMKRMELRGMRLHTRWHSLTFSLRCRVRGGAVRTE